MITLELIRDSILPMMDRLVADPIPNIRFNVAKSYAVLIDTLMRLPADGTLAQLEASGSALPLSPKGLELVTTQIMPNLEKLQQDEDVDVRYYATAAAAHGAERMETSP